MGLERRLLGSEPADRPSRVGGLGGGDAEGVPSRRAGRYLFSALGKPPPAEVRLAARTWIVLGASGAALIVGLLLIYVPPLRHPATLLLLGVALPAAGLIAPAPTMLFAQAAALGLALALVAGMLERAARRRRAAAEGEPSSSRFELRTADAKSPPTGAPAPSSTGTAPLPPQSTGNVER